MCTKNSPISRQPAQTHTHSLVNLHHHNRFHRRLVTGTFLNFDSYTNFTSPPRKMASALPCIPSSRRQYIQRIPAFLTPDEQYKSSSSNSGSWRTPSGGVESKSASISSGYGTPRAMQVGSFQRHLPPAPLMTPSGSASSANSAVYYYLRDGSPSRRDTLAEEAVPPNRKRSYGAMKSRPGENYYKHRGRESSLPSSHCAYDYRTPVTPRRLEDRRKRSADPTFAPAPSSVFTPPIAYSRNNCSHHHHVHKHNHGDHINHSGSRRRSYGRSDYNPSWKIEYNESPGRRLSPTSKGKWKSETKLSNFGQFNVDVNSLDAESTQIYNEILSAAGLAELNSQIVERDDSPPRIHQRYKSCNNLAYDFPNPVEKFDFKPVFEPTERRSNRTFDSFTSSQQRTPTNMPFSPWTPVESTHFTGTDAEEALAELERAVNPTFVNPSKPAIVPIAKHVTRRGNSPSEFSVIEIEEEDENDDPRRGSRDVFPLDEVEKQLLPPIQQLTLSSPIKEFRSADSPEDSNYYSDIDG